MSEPSIRTQTLSNVWRYRSFRDRAEHVKDLNDLLFGDLHAQRRVLTEHRGVA